MPTAKENFIARISNFEKTVSPLNVGDSVLISRALTEIEHNEKVKMLRNGMAIIGYTILEDFVKKRVGEVLKDIGRTTIAFSSLPIKIREAATITALKGIQSRAETLKRGQEDYISFIQNEASFISSTRNAAYEISEYSLGWEKSNISAEDVGQFMNIFNINNGWSAIQQLSAAINITLTNPSQIFKNAAVRRHKAAHNAEADSLLSDLENFVSQAKVIACGFDALLSKSLSHIRVNNIQFLNGNLQTEFNQLAFRFIIEERGNWKETRPGVTRAIRVKGTLNEAYPDALRRAQQSDEILVVKSERNQLLNWHI